MMGGPPTDPLAAGLGGQQRDDPSALLDRAAPAHERGTATVSVPKTSTSPLAKAPAPLPRTASPQGPSREPSAAAVRAVADATTSLAALLYGGFLGALSALLLVHLATQLAPGVVTPLQRAALGLGAWLVSTWLFSRNAGRLVIVFRRAFALGALEWSTLGMAGGREPVASASTGVPVPEAVPLEGSAAVVMAVVCVAGWALCRWSSPPAFDDRRPPA